MIGRSACRVESNGRKRIVRDAAGRRKEVLLRQKQAAVSGDRNRQKVGGDPILISSTLGPAAAAAEHRWA